MVLAICHETLPLQVKEPPRFAAIQFENRAAISTRISQRGGALLNLFI
jgi:hypothetical protein